MKMIFAKTFALLFILLFVIVGTSIELKNDSSNLFPLPEGLRPNVEFWKMIYAKYTEREVLIHDSENLEIIYEVVDLDSLFKGVSVSSRIEWKRIEQIKKQYKSLLFKLSKRKNLKIENLKGKERRIALLFGKNLNSKNLKRAAHRLRGQSGLKDRFEEGLRRSGIYLPKMRKIFEEANLPLELLTLPHVESSFNYKAYSKLGAAGLWQFTRSTGRFYMKINYLVDERLDPITATRSAAKLLKNNYKILGTWPLAITAYNHGPNGMKRAKKKFGTDMAKIVRRYKSRSFGFASRNFYSEFLAALEVSTNYKKYFGDVDFYTSKEFEVFRTPDYITVKTFVNKLNITLEEFAEFNPALRNPVLKSKRRIPKYFEIRLPKSDLSIEELYAKISPQFRFDKQVKPEWHKVRFGENLSIIARKYRVAVHEMMAVNNIKNAHRIYVGQNLQIPTYGHLDLRESVAKVEVEQPKQLAEVAELNPTDKTTVLDVPRSIRVTETDEFTVSKEGASTEKESQSDITQKDVESVTSVEPQVDVKQVDEIQDQTETVEEFMAMALPDYNVEITRDMGPRIVKVSKVEFLHEFFRDIDFPENGQIKIEPDETLGHIAEWLGVSTRKVRAINKLSYSRAIRIGQPLWLTFKSVTPEEFHRRRVEHHQGIEEDFYRNFRVDGQTVYKIKRGDTIWEICNQIYEIPHWLLKKYNPQIDLLRLFAGQEVIIPLIEREGVEAIN